MQDQETAFNLPQKLIVTVKYVYGERRVYPACVRSKRFATLAGTTTLTDNARQIIKQLGYEFVTRQEEI